MAFQTAVRDDRGAIGALDHDGVRILKSLIGIARIVFRLELAAICWHLREVGFIDEVRQPLVLDFDRANRVFGVGSSTAATATISLPAH